ncbi:uncharacterized protein [Rutidosis leptorrhynchoides]|uniref:uncharacterized protein n=1 Tax=Rutidosis leptorrhynchoides TaxID=125765 RepID=UPI003A99031E
MALSKGTKLITTQPQELHDEETHPSNSTKADIYMIHSWDAGQRRKAGVLDNWKHEPIIFPSLFSINPSSEPVIIWAHISNCQIGRIYTDTGAGAEVMFEHCFLQLPESIRRQKKVATSPLVGFNSAATWLIGSITLEVVLGTLPFQSTADIEFSIVKIDSRYNKKKSGGVAECWLGERKVSGSIPTWSDSFYLKLLRIQVGATLSTNAKDTLCKLLAANIDVFAWVPSDRTGVPREIAQHRLNVNPNITPVVQNKRAMALERSKFLADEVQRLVDAGIMKEVKYQTWVANPVMVKKADGSWRMCVDYKDINKACPKDNYPFPEIDWKVESLTGHRFKSFLDAYRGYQQIPMADEEKIVFFKNKGIFCYTEMPFG